MQLATFITGPLRENTYLIWDFGGPPAPAPGSGAMGDWDGSQALLIDPGDEAERIWNEISVRHLALVAILATHAHLDHVGAADALRRWSGAPFLLPAGERDLLNWLPASCRLFGLPEKPVPQVDYWLGPDHRRLSQVFSGQGPDPAMINNDLELQIHHTPGHTADHVCYQLEDHLFVGDTLFSGSVGRTDLPGGDWSTLKSSLLMLMDLPEDTVVHPGHGPATTIGHERRTNPFIVDILAQGDLRQLGDPAHAS